ncbi:MAG: COG4315 family predicted lipoprotein [Nocardioidaceae bacterium]
MRARIAARSTTLAVLAGAGLTLLAACGGGSPYGAANSQTSPVAHTTGRIAVAQTSAGKVLVDPTGRTLYVFAPDSRGHSTCSGSCATYWPPAPAADAAHGATPAVTAKLGSIKRADGSKQLTANGYPVYTYVGDHARGQANGQGTNLSGGLWWVVSPSGTRVADAGAASSGTGGGGGGGY